MHRQLIVGNWKMNGTHQDLQEILTVAQASCGVSNVDSAVCVSFPLLAAAANTVRPVGGLAIGAQDVHHEESGAYTGSVSAGMLVDVGAELVIVGHSERRIQYGETSETVAHKAMAALAHELRVIICIGETAADRSAGRHIEVVRTMLRASLPGTVTSGIAIAYEPIWAIGSGQAATAAAVEEVHAAIRDVLIDRGGEVGAFFPLLYGGSVTARNARELLSVPNVDGALVGGASLQAANFVPIIEIAASISKGPSRNVAVEAQ